MPEEINRRLVDHLSDINMPLTEHARRYLLAEGLRPETVIKTGSPMREVLEHYRPAIEALARPRRSSAWSRAATSWSAPTARRTWTPRSACARCSTTLDALAARARPAR